MSMRMIKINREMRKQIMEIIRHEIDDPSVEILSITRVQTTSDLTESRVYFSLLNDESYEKVQRILDSMSKFIRMNLGKRIRLKTLPQLKFMPDEAIKYSVDIYQKIEDIKRMNNNPQKE